MKSDEEKYLAEEKNIFKELLGWLVYILIIFGLTYLVITYKPTMPDKRQYRPRQR